MKTLNITIAALAAAALLSACGPDESYNRPYNQGSMDNEGQYPQQQYPQPPVAQGGSSVLPAVLGAAAGAAAGYYLGKKSNKAPEQVTVKPPHDGLKPVTPPADVPKNAYTPKPNIPNYTTPGAITPQVKYSNNITAPKPVAPAPSFAPTPYSAPTPSKSFSSPSYSAPSYSFRRK